ncbi:hypothetical protein DFS33DRAFT_874420 [Desarmillaria ectypa]|nr:hypothetical protein DFS33DRAFT_874420 [Desarmillaria ectypa]
MVLVRINSSNCAIIFLLHLFLRRSSLYRTRRIGYPCSHGRSIFVLYLRILSTKEPACHLVPSLQSLALSVQDSNTLIHLVLLSVSMYAGNENSVLYRDLRSSGAHTASLLYRSRLPVFRPTFEYAVPISSLQLQATRHLTPARPSVSYIFPYVRSNFGYLRALAHVISVHTVISGDVKQSESRRLSFHLTRLYF